MTAQDVITNAGTWSADYWAKLVDGNFLGLTATQTLFTLAVVYIVFIFARAVIHDWPVRDAQRRADRAAQRARTRRETEREIQRDARRTDRAIRRDALLVSTEAARIREGQKLRDEDLMTPSASRASAARKAGRGES